MYMCVHTLYYFRPRLARLYLYWVPARSTCLSVHWYFLTCTHMYMYYPDMKIHECIDAFLPSTKATTQGVQGIAVVLGFLPLLLVTREELRMI